MEITFGRLLMKLFEMMGSCILNPCRVAYPHVWVRRNEGNNYLLVREQQLLAVCSIHTFCLIETSGCIIKLITKDDFRFCLFLLLLLLYLC